MQLPDLVVPLYHIDTVEHNQKFCKGGFFPSNEDGDWGGKGMYFWETFSNANKWLITRSRKSSNQVFTMASASLMCNKQDVLDLTNVKSSEALLSIAKLLSTKYDVDLNLSHTGTVINFVHKTLKLQKASKIFSVVKIGGYYPNNHSHGLVAQIENKIPADKSNWPHATELGKVIYAVRSNNLLHNRKIINPEEEEHSYEFSI